MVRWHICHGYDVKNSNIDMSTGGFLWGGFSRSWPRGLALDRFALPLRGSVDGHGFDLRARVLIFGLSFGTQAPI